MRPTVVYEYPCPDALGVILQSAHPSKIATYLASNKKFVKRWLDNVSAHIKCVKYLQRTYPMFSVVDFAGVSFTESQLVMQEAGVYYSIAIDCLGFTVGGETYSLKCDQPIIVGRIKLKQCHVRVM